MKSRNTGREVARYQKSEQSIIRRNLIKHTIQDISQNGPSLEGTHQSRTRGVMGGKERRRNRHQTLPGRMAHIAPQRLLTPGNIAGEISPTSCQWLCENFRPMRFQIGKHLKIAAIRIGFLDVSIHPHPGGMTDISWSFGCR